MPLPTYPYASERLSDEDRRARARRFYFHMDTRRTVRAFSPEPIEGEVLEACLLAASTAPSGAHKQPWRFIIVRSPELKRRIREATERQERTCIGGPLGESWRTGLDAAGAGEPKLYLETAPVVIVVMALWHGEQDPRERHCHVPESVGIACGFLLAALHAAGLAAMPHAPGSAGFLHGILDRPAHEEPVLLIAAGHPARDCRVPDLRRKQLTEISVWK